MVKLDRTWIKHCGIRKSFHGMRWSPRSWEDAPSKQALSRGQIPAAHTFLRFSQWPHTQRATEDLWFPCADTNFLTGQLWGFQGTRYPEIKGRAPLSKNPMKTLVRWWRRAPHHCPCPLPNLFKLSKYIFLIINFSGFITVWGKHLWELEQGRRMYIWLMILSSQDGHVPSKSWEGSESFFWNIKFKKGHPGPWARTQRFHVHKD